MRKIFAISVWGDQLKYVVGAYKQMYLAKYYYPDFERWLFTDEPARYKIDATVIKMPKNTDGQFWRFFAAMENAFILIRDADSRITFREVAAVTEFSLSAKKYHIIRDHPYYAIDITPIFAGNMAIKGSYDNKFIYSLINAMNTPYVYENEQKWLQSHINVENNEEVFTHSMNEGWFGSSRKSLANPYEFVGNGFDENDFPIYKNNVSGNESPFFSEKERLQLPENTKFSQYPDVKVQ